MFRLENDTLIFERRGETVWVQAVGKNGLRVRATPCGGFQGEDWALDGATVLPADVMFEAHAATRGKDFRLVVAVGGGSTLDVGKCLARLMGETVADVDALRARVAGKAWGACACRWIGVPTTAGTGSEVTCWATVWDPEREAKLSLDTPTNYAFAAVADPALTRSMPVGLAVSSALDAVAHATESHWARATNAVSRALAVAAIRTVMTHIDGLFAGDEAARAAMTEGATLAGLAFSGTHTTACHSLSDPLTLRYGIPHGVAVALLLAPVMRLNASVSESTPMPVHSARLFSLTIAGNASAVVRRRLCIPFALVVPGKMSSNSPNSCQLKSPITIYGS